MNLMMLTAGLGTRLRPLTLHLPKPAVPLLNVPLLRYSLTPLEKLGLQNVVFNTHHLPEQLKASVGLEPVGASRVIFSDEQPNILGSGGGIRQAEASLRGLGAFWVANGDSVFFPTPMGAFAELQRHHEDQYPLATLLCTTHPQVGKSLPAVWVDLLGQVQGFGLQPPNGRHDVFAWHFTGFQILSDEVFRLIPAAGAPNIFYDVLLPALSQGHSVQAVCVDGTWLETGSYQDYLNSTLTLLKLYSCPATLPPLLAELLNDQHPVHRDHAFVYCGEDCQISVALAEQTFLLTGHDCRIPRDVQIRGFAVLPDHCHLPAGSELENVVIMPNAKFNEPLRLRDAIAFSQ